MTVGVAVLLVSRAVLVSGDPGVVLEPPLLPVRLEAEPVPGVAVRGVRHDGYRSLIARPDWVVIDLDCHKVEIETLTRDQL